jgi:type VI protein secretion system component VasK
MRMSIREAMPGDKRRKFAYLGHKRFRFFDHAVDRIGVAAALRRRRGRHIREWVAAHLSKLLLHGCNWSQHNNLQRMQAVAGSTKPQRTPVSANSKLWPHL